MIYNQALPYYFISWILAAMILLRMNSYFQGIFDKELAWLVPATIMLHPLSIDMLLGPNLINGALAFLLLIESLLFLKKEKYLLGLFTIIVASCFNIGFLFLALYIGWKHRAELKTFRVPVILWTIFSIMFLIKNLLTFPHNPINFFIYYVQMIIVPFLMTVFSYSLFPFRMQSLVIVSMFLALFLWKQRKNPRSKTYWPILILPALGIAFKPWNMPTYYWQEVLYSPSSYICLTFAFITLLAMHIPRSFFYAYVALMMIFSFNWTRYWFPFSNFLELSVASLPEEYGHKLTARRILAWQYIHEKEIETGMNMLKNLSKENPGNVDLQTDLNSLKLISK